MPMAAAATASCMQRLPQDGGVDHVFFALVRPTVFEVLRTFKFTFDYLTTSCPN